MHQERYPGRRLRAAFAGAMRAGAAAAVLALLACAANAAPRELDADVDADAIHHEAIVVDGHNDVSTWILDFGFDLGMDGWEERDRWGWLWFDSPDSFGSPSAERLRTHTDLARIASGGLDAQFVSIWVSPEYYDPEDPEPGVAIARAHAMIDAVEAQVARHPERLALTPTAAAVRRAVADGKLAVLLGVEGGHAIEDDLENLRALQRRGVRYMTLTWSFSHGWADAADAPLGSASRRHGGLSDFGREVVREMNDLGVLVDISHASDETFWDALETTRAPVIASHSSVRSLADVPRNLSYEMLRALAANGGVAMINFSTMYLDERKTSSLKLGWDWLVHLGGSATTVSHVADHVEHVIRVAGIDHVGLGSDFDGTPFVPTDLRHVGDLPNVTAELLRRGHSETDIRKILGENVLRVLAEAERRAKPQPGKTSPPS